jgi:hypothetical protein
MINKIIIGFLFLLWTSNCSSQINGDWIFSHYYRYDDGYNLAQKRYKKPTLLTFSNDSVIWTNLKGGNRIEQEKYIFDIQGDSLVLKNEFSEMTYWFNKNKDTLKVILTNRNRIKMVFTKTIDKEITENKKEVESILVGKTVLFDYSEVFPKDIQEPIVDTLLINEDKFTINSKDSEDWIIFSSDKNVYLLLNRYLFQIYRIDKNNVVLRNYHGHNTNLMQLDYINN